MKRLQDQNSVYNVYDWEHARKQQVKLVKNICYHPPSLLKKSRKKSIRRGTGFESAKNEPNRQLFELYQSSLRASQEPIMVEGIMPPPTAAPVSGQDSDRKKLDDAHLSSVGVSSDKGGPTLLPEVVTSS